MLLYALLAMTMTGEPAASPPVLTVSVDSTQRVLTIPATDTIICRVLEDSVTEEHGRLTAVEFILGVTPGGPAALSPRTVTIGSDSSGTFFAILDATIDVGADGMPLSSDLVSAVVSREGVVAGELATMKTDTSGLRAARARGDAGAAMQAVQPAETRPLTEDEQVRAGSLARWLWERRCGRG